MEKIWFFEKKIVLLQEIIKVTEMEQVVVKNIPENKLGFFLELVKNLGFSVEKETKEKKLTKKQQDFVNELKDSLNQADLHLQGKIQLKTADQLLNEL